MLILYLILFYLYLFNEAFTHTTFFFILPSNSYISGVVSFNNFLNEQRISSSPPNLIHPNHTVCSKPFFLVLFTLFSPSTFAFIRFVNLGLFSHIILVPTHPVWSGRPQRGSNAGPPHQESRALLTELPPPPPPPPFLYSYLPVSLNNRRSSHKHFGCSVTSKACKHRLAWMD